MIGKDMTGAFLLVITYIIVLQFVLSLVRRITNILPNTIFHIFILMSSSIKK